MTPEQFQQFLTSNEKSTKEAVEKHVNGYMRDMKRDLGEHIVQHDNFMKEVKPILQAYQGGKILGEGIKWLAGVGLAVLAIKGLWK